MEVTPMKEVLQKILLICAVGSLFYSGCAPINTSPETPYTKTGQEIFSTENRIFFPGYSLSISKPSGNWDRQQGLAQDELVLWVNREDGSIIEIMASRSARNLSYHNIALEFTRATCDLILRKTPGVDCEIVNEMEVRFNQKEFYKVDINYQVLKADWAEKSVLYLYRTAECVYHFIFMEANHDLWAPEIMQSIVFLDHNQQTQISTNQIGQMSLIDACYYGDTEVVKEILAHGVNVNATNEDGVTALSYASDRGHMDIVKILLADNADVNARSNIGSTPLMNAAFMGHLHIVEMLVAKGADVDAQSNEGTTALMNAAAQGYTSIVEILLANGADVDACEMCGLTALWNAISGGHVDIVKALIEHGTDINAKANDGTTALMNAVYTGNINIVKMLLIAGADVNAKARNGCTALMLARKKGYAEIVKLLKQAGAVDYIPLGPVIISNVL